MTVKKKTYNGYVIFVIAMILILANVFILKIFSGSLIGTSEDLNLMVRLKDLNEYKKLQCAGLGYEILYPDKTIENLTLIGFETNYGVAGTDKNHQLYAKILRCLRFQNISRKVERKYGLPKNLILAIMMQETGGMELLPNSSDDGGIGLVHMQPSTAVEFGLRTYENCMDLRNTEHGRKLRKLIEKHDYRTEELIYYDDRFHPIINLDAVGRMIAYYMGGTQIENTALKTAIKRYAGKINYEDYYKNIAHYLKKINDTDVIDAVAYEFNKRNPNLLIGGVRADFNTYIEYCQQQNINYGLNKYR